MINPKLFVRANTVLQAPPLTPELRLHLASEVVPIWRKTEEELQSEGVPPPYWAFAWAGGQALARYILDNPLEVRSKSVLDLGAGSGIVAIAAAMAGARSVVAADIDAYAAAAIALNAEANGVAVTTAADDPMLDTTPPWDCVLAGDMFYERPLAERLLAWTRPLAARGIRVLAGDPGRSYFPRSGMKRLATYRVATTRELEDREVRETSVYALSGG